MPIFLTHYKAIAADWPTNRDREIAVWRSMAGHSKELVEDDSAVKFSGWISNSEGYSVVEADSKAEVIRLCAKFWPYFHNEIHELVPTDVAGPAILAGAIEGWEDG